MTLLDHFQPPLLDDCPWESFHSAWANSIVANLNQEWLPDNYRAIPQVSHGTHVEIDVATIRVSEARQETGNGATTAVWAPAQAHLAVQVDFADQDTFEVLIRDQTRRKLVAAVELVSPGNKDRPSRRSQFSVKCAAYLQQRVSLVVVDVVTERRANMHSELMQLLDQPDALVEAVSSALYAVAYRVRQTDDGDTLELWTEGLALGKTLPTLPLWIAEDTAVPLDLEASYHAAGEVLRIMQ